jgi:thioredoxin-related protein
MKNIVILFLLLCSMSNARAQETDEILEMTGSWKEVLAKAKQQNKLIFVDCYFTGCHPCAQMDKEVFPNARVKKELSENFVGIKIDVFKEKLGDTINMKYGVSGFPTFLILNEKGELLSMFSGYKDAGLLINNLEEAKSMNKRNESLGGFSPSNTVDYEAFYKDYFNRSERKSDPVAANAWIKKQPDWTYEPVAMAIFKTRQLDVEIENHLLQNFSTYLKKYGEALAISKADEILSSRLGKAINKTVDEVKFRYYLSEQAKLFPKEEWDVLNFLLGYKYYGSIAKDTIGLLRFINEKPLLYMNYIGSLYNTMVVRKQLNNEALSLLCNWAFKAVNEESAFDMISMAARMCKQNSDLEGFRRFIAMAIAKAKKYNVPSEGYEKMLAAN